MFQRTLLKGQSWVGDDSFTNQRASLNYNPNQLGARIRSENRNSEDYNTEIKKKTQFNLFIWIPRSDWNYNNKSRKQIYTMQGLTTLLLTITTLLLLSNAVKASPVLPLGDDETSAQELRDLPVEQHQQLKRICGMSWFGCRKQNGVKRNVLFIIVFVLLLLFVFNHPVDFIYVWKYTLSHLSKSIEIVS